MESGEVDDYWWDDFINVPIKNPELDAIRERCDEIWREDSQFLEKSKTDDEYHLNEIGMNEIRKLIQRCELIASNKQLHEDRA